MQILLLNWRVEAAARNRAFSRLFLCPAGANAVDARLFTRRPTAFASSGGDIDTTFNGGGSQESGRFSTCQGAIVLENNLSASILPNSKVRTVIDGKPDLITELVGLIGEGEAEVMDVGLRCLMHEAHWRGFIHFVVAVY
ncbi:hypothetical protein KSP39_PZI002598 [Platanthera zijinensis]|uniref:Uncharacterized protein n=1 Tax=Platanthera zijinensis TaxID=2320716 RepID=A0AAP0BXJ7_9ASPA